MYNEWFEGETSIVDYIRFFPVLLYAKSVNNINIKELKRFSRFFYNIARFEDIAKNPTDQCVHTINLCIKFFENKYTDIVDILHFSNDPPFQNILTNEEVFKLDLFKRSPISLTREEVETVLWKLEDFSLCNGKIEFIMDCLNYSFMNNSNVIFDFDKLKAYSSLFIEMFYTPTDLLRKALLSKGDYALLDGYTSKLEGDRYSLATTGDHWKQLIKNTEKNIYIKALLGDSYDRLKTNPKSIGEILTDIIEEYLNHEETEEGWIYHFISNPKILEYCQDKKFCYISDEFEDIYLLERTRATSYKQLLEFIS